MHDHGRQKAERAKPDGRQDGERASDADFRQLVRGQRAQIPDKTEHRRDERAADRTGDRSRGDARRRTTIASNMAYSTTPMLRPITFSSSPMLKVPDTVRRFLAMRKSQVSELSTSAHEWSVRANSAVGHRRADRPS